ncbi:MAG: helix-turn-helix transcriptional regulator [bacterium]|nr:helix-turn-helix transcriptional regulator [bacterium]
MKIQQSLTDAAVLEEIGKRLARQRVSAGLTQSQAATEAGLSMQTISRIENGAGAQLSSFIRLLRTLDLLDALDVLVPKPRASPIELLRLQGKQRKRASSPRSEVREKVDWSWGEDA